MPENGKGMGPIRSSKFFEIFSTKIGYLSYPEVDKGGMGVRTPPPPPRRSCTFCLRGLGVQEKWAIEGSPCDCSDDLKFLEFTLDRMRFLKTGDLFFSSFLYVRKNFFYTRYCWKITPQPPTRADLCLWCAPMLAIIIGTFSWWDQNRLM